MLGIENALLLVTAILNVGLGVLLYFQGKRRAISSPFVILIICLAGWTAGILLFRIDTSYLLSLISIKATFMFALIISLSLFYFSYVYPPERQGRDPVLATSLILIGTIASVSILASNLIVSDIAHTTDGKIYLTNEIGYIIYAWLFLTFYGGGLAKLWQRYFNSDGIRKRQSLYICLGLTIAGVVGAYMNLILPSPFFANYNWIAIGPFFGTAIVVSIVYTVYRYQLFETKVIVTEIITFLIWLAILLRSLLSTTAENTITNYSLLVVMTFFGAFLVSSVHKEVSAREEAEELTEELKYLNEQKSKMLSIASHQFRSPLTSIEGYASLMKNGSYGEISGNLKEPVRRILKSSKKLATIVDDFLNISRIEDDRMEYNFQVADLEGIVQEVIAEAKSTINSDNLSLEITTDGSENYRARVDIGKIQQVITNLVDNAIKYTEVGSVTAHLKKNNGNVLVEVEDTGIGIDPEDSDIIFEQFSRANEAENTNVVGSGLGLYIAKQIVKAHNGGIWATSPGKGEGSTFHVKLQAPKR